MLWQTVGNSPSLEMSADIYPKVSLLEERLKFWRIEIVRCLDKPTFLSQLAAKDVFNEDEKSRLYDIYQNRTATEAGEAVLDSFGRSSAPNKWMSFLNALEQEELVYVKSLLEEDNVGSEKDRLRGRKLIRLFGPELEKTINPIDIISSLVSKKAITEVDRDEVLNLCHTKSRLYGIMCLLRRMQSQLRPREWYYEFLRALRDNDYTSECELLEPDFLECPHMFDPENVCETPTDGVKEQQTDPDPVHEDDAVQSDEDELDSDSEYKDDFQRARKVVVMARTGILIRQQADRFKQILPNYNTKFISGGEDESTMLHVFVKDADILCFTPKILVNNLENGNIPSLAVFSLLIFDECHHTKGSGAYGELARLYLTEKFDRVAGLPQIVGLTASIGVGNAKNEEDAVEYITKVCATLDVKRLSTVERCRTSFEKHVNTPKEDTIKMTVRVKDPCRNVLIQNMIKTEDILNDICFSVCEPDIIDVLDKRPRERGTIAYYGWTIQIDKTAKRFVHDPETNETKEEAERRSKFTDQEKELFENFKELQKDLTKKSRDVDAANPNVEIICDQLTKMFQEKGPESRAMVFVKARATCLALGDLLDKRLVYKARCLYGQKKIGSMNGMSQEEQTEVLERFKEGRFKIIVCTSVAIEGIDVPDCNIVINYNYSGDEITKIQMRGRSRTHDASTVTLGNEKLVEKDMVNVYKANLMYKAMDTFKKMDAHELEHKLYLYQKEEVRKQINKTDLLEAMRNRQSSDDMEILCVKCMKYICHVSSMRVLSGSQHFVITEEFPEKADRKPHKRPERYFGLDKKEKMSCKRCGQDWGIVAQGLGYDIFVFKIGGILFRQEDIDKIQDFQKWGLAPKMIDCTLDEIPKLLAYQNRQK
ncbi:DDX58-like protein [Mya arenaria]|uniref:DDX58-like protein n=1 Tax=Mya arenaria TaxID=6604 RepID=A0ABY7FIV0_MYAAR|nr:DDX58-like protein [Mya arenaria]